MLISVELEKKVQGLKSHIKDFIFHKITFTSGKLERLWSLGQEKQKNKNSQMIAFIVSSFSRSVRDFIHL
jgi:hypothetical protein